MRRLETDPKVSCPIVCGEYMRASGFFYEISGDVFLVTARHNVLPTEPEYKQPNGQEIQVFSSQDCLPAIDIYLQGKTGWESFRYDIRKDSNSVYQSSGVDILGVQVDIHPNEYGYRVWQQEDVSDGVKASERMDVIGFNGDSFPDPDREYDKQLYQNQIGRSRCLSVLNVVRDKDPSDFGFLLPAVDEEFEGEYNGLSGAPVTDDNDLIGVHAMEVSMPETVNGDLGNGAGRTMYSRAAILNQLFK